LKNTFKKKRKHELAAKDARPKPKRPPTGRIRYYRRRDMGR